MSFCSESRNYDAHRVQIHSIRSQGSISQAKLPSARGRTYVGALTASPDGNLVGYRTTKRTTCIYEINPLKLLFSITHGDHIEGSCFSPKSTYFVVGDRSSMAVVMWSVKTRKEVARIKCSGTRFDARYIEWSIFVSPDKRRLGLMQACRDYSPGNKMITVYELIVQDSWLGGGSGNLIVRCTHELPIPWSRSASTVRFKSDKLLAATDRDTSSYGVKLQLEWEIFEISYDHTIPLRIYKAICKTPNKRYEGTGRDWKSENLERILVLVRDTETRKEVLLELTECHDASSQDVRQFEVVRKEEPSTLYDISMMSSFRLYSDGWLWDGSRRVTWIPREYRPAAGSTYYYPFAEGKNMVRKLGDGVLLFAEDRGHPLILCPFQIGTSRDAL